MISLYFNKVYSESMINKNRKQKVKKVKINLNLNKKTYLQKRANSPDLLKEKPQSCVTIKWSMKIIFKYEEP